MTSGDDRSVALRESLRQVQRGVWGVLVVCALVSFTQDGVDPEPAPHPRATTTAIGLAFVAIVSRLVGDSPRGGVRLDTASAASMCCSMVGKSRRCSATKPRRCRLSAVARLSDCNAVGAITLALMRRVNPRPVAGSTMCE